MKITTTDPKLAEVLKYIMDDNHVIGVQLENCELGNHKPMNRRFRVVEIENPSKGGTIAKLKVVP